ncbi:MAG: hypothetical protein A2Y38_11430, partial [Spirochaetes bacterium GWB1_59_5]
MLEYHHSMSQVLAVDVGGTKTAIGIVDGTGTIVEKRIAPTPRGDASAVVTMVRSMVDSLGERARSTVALGLALPGVMDRSGEVLLRSPSSGWYDVPFTRLFSDALGLKAIADNDVNACALAEAVFGSAVMLDSFFWITVSTGVGGALYQGRRVLAGAHGMAGEIGHLVVKPDGARCGCGNHGCLEAEAAGPAWSRKLIAQQVGDSGAYAAAKGQTPLDARAIAESARNGDARCLRVVDQVSEALARGMAAVLTLFDPQAIFLGGGVAGASDLLLPRIEARL